MCGERVRGRGGRMAYLQTGFDEVLLADFLVQLSQWVVGGGGGEGAQDVLLTKGKWWWCNNADLSYFHNFKDSSLEGFLLA